MIISAVAVLLVCYNQGMRPRPVEIEIPGYRGPWFRGASRRVSAYLVYGLTDPTTAAIRYIGKSSAGLERPREHVGKIGRETTHKANWIRVLLQAGAMYGIRVLEECSDFDQAAQAEIRWIAEGRRAGWPLTNLTDGGEGASCEVTQLPNEEVVRRYQAGESEFALAAAFGTSRTVIANRLRKAGVQRRSGSEANVLRMERTDPAERKRNASAAHAATRGKPWTAAEHVCRACGVAGHTAKSQKYHPGLIAPGPGRKWTKSAEAIRLGL